MITSNFNRRFFLKSSSACIALPFLQSLANTASAQSSSLTGTSATGVGTPLNENGIPKRLVFLPMGYGVNQQNWFPTKPGKDYELPPLVEPFAPHKNDISFIQNLKVNRIPTPHSGTGNFLNCSEGKQHGISCDQIAASLLGKDTRFDYVALGNPGRADGHGTLPNYDAKGKPVGAYRNTKSFYVALFGKNADPQKVKAQLARNESSLDALLSDAKKLNKQVSAEDRDRVDEYFTSLRNIEKRLSKAQEWASTPYPKAPFNSVALAGRGKKVMELIFDMMVIAMQSDTARVLSYALPSQLVGVANPHKMSHRAKGDWVPGQPTQHQERDYALAQQVSRFLTKLKEIKEADGSTVFDNSLVAYGSTLASGHNVGKGPFILAGHGGGGLTQGQNIITKNSPLANVWLSVLRHVGVQQDTFANSNNVIKQMGFS